MIINAIRGIHVLVPRNMTKAAGFYNSFRMWWTGFSNRVFKRISLKREKATQLWWIQDSNRCCWNDERRCWYYVSFYGSTLRLIEQAAQELLELYWLWDYRCTVFASIRYQSWSCKSIAKTSRLLVIDEDVPGGASAYILQQIIEQQMVITT
jgi:hypothetical protein